MARNGNPIEHEWVLRGADEATCRSLARELGISRVTAQILTNRGIVDVDSARRYLEPTLEDLHDPFSMKDMLPAVAEVLKAIERGDRIMIHGDYDVDGVCSVSVLYGFLRDIGANVAYFIPQRGQDGYGVNIESVRRFQADGVGLMITTDCGISNYDEILLGNQLGLRTVVIDHHTIPPQLPPARAILNPLQEDCEFPFKQLAAVGVTFNFVVALRSELRKRGVFRVVPEPDLERYLDLVAMGTIADVMPLIDENRLLVKLGLEVLAKRRRAGTSALLDRANVPVGPVDTRTVSFRLAPRINAAGRMTDASMCVELLTTRDYGKATKLATELDDLNSARQDEERGILEAALEQAEEQASQDAKVLVVSGKLWHRGVLGIVASRLMETFHRPAILMGIEEGVARGSARSIEGINLIDALRKVDGLLSTYGGHSLAAGLSLEEGRLRAFRERVQDAVGEVLDDGRLPRPTLMLDGSLEFADIDHDLATELSRLAPFGTGNPEPLLLATKTFASNVRVVGERHIRARFRDASGSLDGFGFALSDTAELLKSPVSLAFVPRQFESHGRRRLELQIRGVRPATREVPDRHEPPMDIRP